MDTKFLKIKLLLSIGLLHCGMFVLAQSKSFKIEGHLPGWTNKEQIALFYGEGDSQISDTVEVINGKFVFTGTTEEAVEAKIACISRDQKGLRDMRQFYLQNGKITLKGTDALKTAMVSGKGATSEFEDLHAKLGPLMERMLEVRLKGMRMGKKMDSATYNSLVKENLALAAEIDQTDQEFIRKYPASAVAMNMLVNRTRSIFNVDKVEAMYGGLSASLKKSPKGAAVAKLIRLAKTTRIGAVLPDFSSKDTLGKSLTLNEVVKKGKVTLVDFWASWCKPCREENPNVVKAFKAFHDKGFNILSVSLDQNASAWKKAIEKDGMPWYHVSSLKYWDEPIVIQFGITGVPDSFLLDADGKIIARGLRGDALYKKIEEIIY